MDSFYINTLLKKGHAPKRKKLSKYPFKKRACPKKKKVKQIPF
jgi:hypothetical protein